MPDQNLPNSPSARVQRGFGRAALAAGLMVLAAAMLIGFTDGRTGQAHDELMRELGKYGLLLGLGAAIVVRVIGWIVAGFFRE